MKILMLNHEFPPVGGGASPVTLELCAELVRQGRCACGDLQAAGAALVMQRYGLELLPGEADRLVRAVVVAPLPGRADRIRVNGRAGSFEARVSIDVEDVAGALEPVVARMLNGVTALVRELPVLYGAEIVETGILLTGGGDVSPHLYGELPDRTFKAAEPHRDALELELAVRAIELDVPVLAICRGLQVLNVAVGGTLVQDIPSRVPRSITHKGIDGIHSGQTPGS